MNVMDCEQFDCSFSPSYMINQFECSLENAFPFQANDLLSPNSILDEMFDQDQAENLSPANAILDEMFDQESIEELLQQHAENLEVMNLDLGNELCHRVTKQAQENVHVSKEGDKYSYLKGIQAELMEETSVVDLLLTAAEAVEAQNWAHASDTIEKLNNDASSLQNGDNLLNRLALFFAQGLFDKISTPTPKLQYCDPVSTPQTSTFCVLQILQELSPYVKFAHFTANQAILEATEGVEDIHIIDFDIMEGIQWPPLMADLAMRKSTSTTSLRVTAITVDQQSAASAHQTGRRLEEFAASINFPFTFNQVMMVSEEDLQRIELGHTLIANCMIHQWMPNRSFSLIKTFLDGVSKLSPRLVVLVEEELFNFSKLKFMSFVEFFCEALHHYTALSDSLARAMWGNHKVEFGLIEKQVLGLRIMDSVRQFPCEREERMLWEEGCYSLKGYKRVGVSSSNISQARFLVSLFGKEYWVQFEKYRLALCWKSRPLTVASIWVPVTNLSDKVK